MRAELVDFVQRTPELPHQLLHGDMSVVESIEYVMCIGAMIREAVEVTVEDYSQAPPPLYHT